MLQEKMSHYLETMEVHLVQIIASPKVNKRDL
jgi:hypothetical protein